MCCCCNITSEPGWCNAHLMPVDQCHPCKGKARALELIENRLDALDDAYETGSQSERETIAAIQLELISLKEELE